MKKNYKKYGLPASQKPELSVLVFSFIVLPILLPAIFSNFTLFSSFGPKFNVFYMMIVGMLMLVFLTNIELNKSEMPFGFSSKRQKITHLPVLENYNYKKWLIAIAAFIAINSVLYFISTEVRMVEVSLLAAVSGFITMFFLIALPEEIWFRGFWFWATGNRFIPSVVGGAVVFALLHFQKGLLAISVAFGLGLIYGVARYRGSSLLSIALVHATLNWQHRNLFQYRYEGYSIEKLSIYILGGYILIAILLLLVFKADPRIKKPKLITE